MNDSDARAWNAAIDAAVGKYKEGVGAIQSLRVRYAVTVDHVGRSTKQEVVDLEKDG